jgi:multimeric flavodoxin WrbA
VRVGKGQVDEFSEVRKMREQTATPSGGRLASSKTIVAVLLACGVLSSLLYVATDVVASLRWVGYSYVDQAVSELNAIGSPTRPLTLALFSVYNLLVIAFAGGVWASAGKKRSVRVAAVMLVVYAVVGAVTNVFSPMHVRGSATAGTDIGHIILTAVEVFSIVLFMAFGSGARAKGFRLYSVATILILIVAGAVVGAQAPHMTAAAASTPWAGILERVNIYGTLMWVLVFAVVLRSKKELASIQGGDAAEEAESAKKVTVLMGSPHKGGATYVAARKFLDHLESYGDVNGEIVALSDYDIGVCRGCKTCFEWGEERCPLKDDRDVLIEKMTASDAVVFASPNYSWHVSGVMKVFLDRLGFAFHRPRFHGRTSSAIVVQGIYRGRNIRKYLEFVGGGLGFKVVRGSVIHTLEPMPEKAVRKMDEALAEQSRRFHRQLLRPAHPAPSLLELMMFRMGRTGIKAGVGEDKCDHMYYRDQGWFESDYYYPTHLGPFKKAAGVLFDWAGAHMSTFQVADEVEAAAGPPSSGPAAK